MRPTKKIAVLIGCKDVRNLDKDLYPELNFVDDAI